MYRKKSLTNFILLTLEKAVDGYMRIEDFASNPGLYAYYSRDFLKKSSLSQALKRLREGGLIELVSDRDLTFRLTDKGREKVVLASFLQDNKAWDGKWRLVIFDVPEKRRTVRDILRRKLKDWGFIPFQQSVWGTKKNCTKSLRNFIKSVGIGDWVMVIESDDIGK